MEFRARNRSSGSWGQQAKMSRRSSVAGAETSTSIGCISGNRRRAVATFRRHVEGRAERSADAESHLHPASGPREMLISFERGSREFKEYWDGSPDEGEQALVAEVKQRYGHSITAGQLAWHRWMRTVKIAAKILEVNQEFPWTGSGVHRHGAKFLPGQADQRGHRLYPRNQGAAACLQLRNGRELPRHQSGSGGECR